VFGRILAVDASLATGVFLLSVFFLFPVVAAETAFRLGRRRAALVARSAERSAVDADQTTSPADSSE
jgi:hypothetical protein